MSNSPIRRVSCRVAASILACFAPVNSGFTQIPLIPKVAPPATLTYADVADLFTAAQVVLRAKIVSAIRIKDAPVGPGSARFFVEADASALIRGPEGLPPRVRYLVDVAPDSRGKLPKLKKLDVILAAQPVSGRPGEIQLVAPDAQQVWTPALESRVRALVISALAADATPPITGIASAFHVPGTVIGEGESQIFLNTATGAPVSLSILRRPGEEPRWALALGEIVDEAAAVPARDTLTWYRLACFLPADLPPAAARDLSPSDADSAREDYGLVRQALGPCPRNRR